MASHTLKAENKPTLFSFDLETEYKNIDRWILDHKRYSKHNLETEAQMLRAIVKDFIEIIETKNISEQHLKNLRTAIVDGAAGIWEPATTKLELLSYHFEAAKKLIVDLLNSSDSKIVVKVLTTVSDAFSTDEQIGIFTLTFNHKSKTVREGTAQAALRLRNKELIDFLKQQLENQTYDKVKESIKFAIDNMWQPSGSLTFSMKSNS